MDIEPQKAELVPVKTHPEDAHVGVKIVAALLVVAISYMVGFKAGEQGYTIEPKEFKVVNKKNQVATVDYQLLWDAMEILNKKFIDKPINPQKMLYGAIRGAVASAGDPYTDFFEPKALQSFKTDLKGSFGGIGAEIGKKDGVIVIISPIDDTPAKKAGLLAKDIILQVNGKSTAEWSVEQTVDQIRGEKGTKVTLSLYRAGKDKPFDVNLVREDIKVKSVKWEIKNVQKDGKDKKIAIITLSRFGDDTKALFDKAVNDILTKSVDGIVLDLRNNPGGYLQTSVDLASNWIERGKNIVSEDNSSGSKQQYVATGNNRLSAYKTVVLINGGSASAAEILSGALHDYKIAELIGEKSFGKGSVQELIDLKDGSAIKVTIAKWITPNGRNLNKDGLEPDIAVKITEENITKNQDPQMEKAMEEVTK